MAEAKGRASRNMIRMVLLAAFYTTVFGQDISMRGKVTNSAGMALPGVIVKLISASKSDTTDINGMYSLTGLTANANRPRVGKKTMVGISFDTGQFLVEANSETTIQLVLYDVRGARIGEIYSGKIQVGRNRIPYHFHGLDQSICLLKVGWENRASYYKLALVNQKVASLTSVGALNEITRFAKITGGDWIQAYKEGYAFYSESINSYPSVLNITLSASVAPDFGPNVLVFDPSMPATTIQSQIDTVWARLGQHESQFSDLRYALLFKPGAYNLNVDVGYYTQVLGLGRLPDDVAITGTVLSTFWRGAENMSVIPTPVNTWAVSQAAPFRRMHVKGGLNLSDGGFASGGFLADSKIDGVINSGSQQQWFTRNTDMTGGWKGGVWNMFFIGCTNPPLENWPTNPYTIIPATPVVREKPFLHLNKDGKFSVFVPETRQNSSGPSWENGAENGESLPLDLFYVTKKTDNAASINAALKSGKNLLFTPGIYHLEASIQVTRPNTVVLGIGIPTLIPDKGTSAIEVSDVDGVKIAGILIDAGPINSPTLVQVGEMGSKLNHAANPTSLHDVFCRIGGANLGSASANVIINSGNVISDHFWLWRADHGLAGTVGWDLNSSDNGLIVNGDSATVYGLFTEHHGKHQTIWNGNGGRTYFLQSEIAYDVPSQAAWNHDGKNGWAIYKVGDAVTSHEAWGLGIYSNFKNGPIILDNSMEAPQSVGVKFHHLVNIWLNGTVGSEMTHVVNGVGSPATSANRKATITNYP